MHHFCMAFLTQLVFSCRLFDKTFAILLWVYIGNIYDFTNKFMIIYESLFNMVCH
jgi:hypothetical protein